jgi:hypothetical protein
MSQGPSGPPTFNSVDEDAAASGDRDSVASSGWSSWTAPHTVALGAIAVVSAVLLGPLRDLDLPWHVLIGDEIRATGRIGGLGNDWSLYADGNNWITTQWLSEVILSLVVEMAGWNGIVVLRAVGGTALLALTAWLCFRWARPWVATGLFLAILPTVLTSIQERPNLATMLMAVWLSHTAWRLRRSPEAPPWWVGAALVALWANFHGGWILAPLAFALVALVCLLDRDGVRARHATKHAMAAIGGACLTPTGVATLAQPFGFLGSTSHLREWQPTQPLSGWYLGLAVCGIALSVAWARSRSSIGWGSLLWAGAWLGFGLLAFRNVAPAVLMLVPLVASSLDEAIPRRRPRVMDRGLFAAATTAVIVSGAVLIASAAMRLDPLAAYTPSEVAMAVAERASSTEEFRVLNAYNAAGPLLLQREESMRLAIDGRADRFSTQWIDDLNAAQAGAGDIDGVLTKVDPDAVVTPRDSGLQNVLVERGWLVESQEEAWTLLVPGSDRS